MSSTVYIETSVIGYLTSRPSRDLLTAANQQLTHDWWNERRGHFDIYISQFVIDECAAGDAIAAKGRLDVLTHARQLAVTGAVETLGEALIHRASLPEQAQVDALHISISAVHGMEYLLTWNCTHIANAVLRPRIEAVCRLHGYEPPIICTPQELMEA